MVECFVSRQSMKIVTPSTCPGDLEIDGSILEKLWPRFNARICFPVVVLAAV